ncbi:MAG: tetratricopeptide repeat protein [Prevotella sp.]|jgi:tetratricopeptide (TPR) repeat protein|nr:tetratricopeptide repeat protein [Prevotella sp.]
MTQNVEPEGLGTPESSNYNRYMHKKIYILCLVSLILISGSSRIYAQKSKQAESNKELNFPVKRLPVEERRKFDYYFYEAMKAKSVNKYDAAFDLLKYCQAIDSTNANVYFELGNYYSLLDNKNKALDFFRKATAYDSDNFYYNMAYASLCLEFKQYGDAIEEFEKLTRKNPENTELYLYLAEAYRQNGDLAGAVSILDRLEQITGLNEKVSLQKFQLYTMMKQEKKAYGEIQKFIDKYPAEIKYHVLLGDLYLQAGEKDEAFSVYSKAKAIDPEDPYLISSMAEYYEQTNNKEAAESELNAALVSPKMDIDTKLAILAQYVGTLQTNNHGTQTANALFDTLMVQHPQEPKLNLMYGNLLMMQKKQNEARFQFQVYADANPTNPFGWEQMLSTTFPDSVSLSIKICKDAISYIPDQPQFYFYLGISEYLNKDYANALDALQKGVVYVDEKNISLLSDFYGQIGDLYYHTDKKDSAYVAYDKALAYKPNNLGVLNNYSYYLSLDRKNLDKAEKMSSMTVKAEPSNPTYLDTYGWVLFEQGAYTMAKIYIENAVKYNEDKKEESSAEVLEHYGDVLYKTNEPEKALEYWIKAKEKGDSESETLDKKIETKTYIAK